MFNIIETFTDIAGKYRVRVDLVDETVFFKFNNAPTQEEVDWECIYFLTLRENNGAPN